MVLARAAFLLFSAWVCAASQGCALRKTIHLHRRKLEALKEAEAAGVDRGYSPQKRTPIGAGDWKITLSIKTLPLPKNGCTSGDVALN